MIKEEDGVEDDYDQGVGGKLRAHNYKVNQFILKNDITAKICYQISKKQANVIVIAVIMIQHLIVKYDVLGEFVVDFDAIAISSPRKHDDILLLFLLCHANPILKLIT